ncbi:phosphoribosylformylglycinamidine cyclo-ligase [Lottiidibacillus patelloidae]|uniref:Phosphoribosylformylglycinamidine cyclo-ligase n=1 Tax=Lottiidibacillus patelloidae TaxID=2670334 RepID=A0A263BR98_9BACI|nr:phosphoribosylformylglycinamidine cyclo-ligase [Lottiidibacillus patelloidae]OZM56233.1 phosphoribosylformylglycinamidine cyclo-ligase [Lottiidibacillus patelloidae]
MVNAYKQAGVDIKAGYKSVSLMKKHVQKTLRPEVIGSLGGFGGMFDLSQLKMKEPVLISGADGVGTKLMITFQMNRHDTIGIDAVAMCVNDIIVQGAEPLYFLDYLALGKAIPEKVEQIVKGVAEGCQQAGCSLIGGETAEMPGMYKEDEYDIGGFAVGAVEKRNIISGETIQSGDVIVGISSSGIHSNGFSLVRKVLLEEAKLSLDDYVASLGKTLGEELLTPTKIYANQVLSLIKTMDIKGMAHITGGGFAENIPRMLPLGLGAKINSNAWKVPEIFNLIQKIGNLADCEMRSVFNMGIGFALTVAKEDAEKAVRLLNQLGETAFIIGKVTAESGVSFE